MVPGKALYRIAVSAVFSVAAAWMVLLGNGACNQATARPVEAVEPVHTEYIQTAVMSEPEQVPLVDFVPARYALTSVERDLVERVVFAEAGTEDFDGQRLVAQCILNACEKEDVRPAEAVRRYRYTKPAKEAGEETRRAVRAVFDRGEMVTSEAVLFFYAPRYGWSAWHESQTFVLEHGNHRFFK